MRNSIAICLACLLVACIPTPVPQNTLEAPTPAYAKFAFDIVDDITGIPVTASLTLRREKLDGTLIDETQTFTGQRIEFDAPVDPDVKVFILVEADGYNDWELAMRIKMAGTLEGPIRLRRVNAPTPVRQVG